MQMTGNILIASDGMYLTNGETYAKRVYLAVKASPDDWWEVTDAEAEVAMTELTAEEALEELREALEGSEQ